MATIAAKPMPIAQLMETPHPKRDLAWIEAGLQSAIALELATLPPYLCGMWSIKTEDSEAERLITNIVHDEMFHMGMVCNMMSAIGGTPYIIAAAPKYPGKLPGNVRPQIDVYLQGLTQQYVRDVFMEIEMPENPLALLYEEWVTIGKFYDALREAFTTVNPAIVAGHQLEKQIGDNMLPVFSNVADIVKAIDVIKEQGEGTGHGPEDPTLPKDGQGLGPLAHYYSFGEIWKGRRLAPSPTGPLPFDWIGEPVPFPETHPMGRLKTERWPDPSANVQKLLNAFNEKYTEMLDHLEQAWHNGDDAALGRSVGAMFGLKSRAHALMKEPLPGDDSHRYGPEFLIRFPGDDQG
ncbi:ferritin-like protein [Streptomyces sp. NPDC006872]|uniref:ferritin-like domain-containing protein n=1 Tax=Streptomyces sp. NPDC006872 TaxID=3155720 RepID=UPI0033F2CCFC